MSAKKRKSDLPENVAAAKVASPHEAEGGGDDESDHTTTRMQRDEAQAKLAAALLENERLKLGRDAELAAALLENERLRAAAAEPCACGP